MTPFTETMRHDHPIAKDDWVLEIGAHKGYDTAIFAEKYGCAIVAYEPVKEFFLALVERFSAFAILDKLHLVRAGVGGSHRVVDVEFGVQGERSGASCAGNYRESVSLVPIVKILTDWTDVFGRPPALIQINAEGGEYEILEALAVADIFANLLRIQVQFHSVLPDCRVRRAAIYERVSRTHKFLWAPGEFDTGWVGWERK